MPPKPKPDVTSQHVPFVAWLRRQTQYDRGHPVGSLRDQVVGDKCLDLTLEAEDMFAHIANVHPDKIDETFSARWTQATLLHMSTEIAPVVFDAP